MRGEEFDSGVSYMYREGREERRKDEERKEEREGKEIQDEGEKTKMCGYMVLGVNRMMDTVEINEIMNKLSKSIPILGSTYHIQASPMHH